MGAKVTQVWRPQNHTSLHNDRWASKPKGKQIANIIQHHEFLENANAVNNGSTGHTEAYINMLFKKTFSKFPAVVFNSGRFKNFQSLVLVYGSGAPKLPSIIASKSQLSE